MQTLNDSIWNEEDPDATTEDMQEICITPASDCGGGGGLDMHDVSSCIIGASLAEECI